MRTPTLFRIGAQAPSQLLESLQLCSVGRFWGWIASFHGLMSAVCGFMYCENRHFLPFSLSLTTTLLGLTLEQLVFYLWPPLFVLSEWCPRAREVLRRLANGQPWAQFWALAHQLHCISLLPKLWSVLWFKDCMPGAHIPGNGRIQGSQNVSVTQTYFLMFPSLHLPSHCLVFITFPAKSGPSPRT